MPGGCAARGQPRVAVAPVVSDCSARGERSAVPEGATVCPRLPAEPERRPPGESPRIGISTDDPRCGRTRASGCSTDREADVEDERSLHVEVFREGGVFWCQVAEWEGCFASGETLPELMMALEEALALYVTPEDQAELKRIELRLDAMDLRVRASPPPVVPAREQAARGPLRTPPRSHSPHPQWGFGDFDRRPHD